MGRGRCFPSLTEPPPTDPPSSDSQGSQALLNIDILSACWGVALTTSRLCNHAGAAHLAKLTKSDDTKLTAGAPLLLCQLLLSEQPAPSKARYPPIPPSSTLKISSVFVQLGVVEHLRQHLLEANDQLKSAQSGADIVHPLYGSSWRLASRRGNCRLAMHCFASEGG